MQKFGFKKCLNNYLKCLEDFRQLHYSLNFFNTPILNFLINFPRQNRHSHPYRDEGRGIQAAARHVHKYMWKIWRCQNKNIRDACKHIYTHTHYICSIHITKYRYISQYVFFSRVNYHNLVSITAEPITH